jgi:dTDP-4-amino-4,6-dideoxygalactose transaminase
MAQVLSSSPLAIHGGTPVRTRPLPAWPYSAPDEIEAAAAVLRSGRLNYWTGEEGREFEKEYAAFSRTRHAIAVANGTVALELALYALGIGEGDEVITTSRTFIASASCIILRGARPVFADVHPDSGTITADTIRPLITPATRAIIVVHLAGWPCEMAPIMELARAHNIKVVEDCAQAHGAEYHGRPVGSFGHANAFSFCQDKIMTTGGEGGLLTTDDEQVWERAWSFKDHGKSFDAVYRRSHGPGFRWLHESFGTNWRLTEIQSAVGRVLLRKLPQMVETRRRNARVLDTMFRQIPGLRVAVPAPGIHHSYYKYYAYVRPERLRDGWDRDAVMTAIAAEGVPCFAGSCSEVYLEQAFPEALRPPSRLPVARALGETSLMFLVHPTLGETDMLDVARAVEKVMTVACR